MNVGRIDELSLVLLNTVEIILKMIVRRFVCRSFRVFAIELDGIHS